MKCFLLPFRTFWIRVQTIFLAASLRQDRRRLARARVDSSGRYQYGFSERKVHDSETGRTASGSLLDTRPAPQDMTRFRRCSRDQPDGTHKGREKQGWRAGVYPRGPCLDPHLGYDFVARPRALAAPVKWSAKVDWRRRPLANGPSRPGNESSSEPSSASFGHRRRAASRRTASTHSRPPMNAMAIWTRARVSSKSTR